MGVMITRVLGDYASGQTKQKLSFLCLIIKKFAKAIHNTWAVIFADGRQVKDDDGESGAGNIMLKMLDQAQLHNRLIIVARWYGGVHLGADRFRHVKACVTTYLNEFCTV